MAAVEEAFHLSVIPCTAMLVMSALTFAIEVPKTVVRCFQHLAAGIVLSAVAVELVPIISAAPSDMPNIVGIVVGFAAGVALFLSIANFCPADGADGGSDIEDEKAEAMLDCKRTPSKVTSYLSACKAASCKAKSKSTPPFPFTFTLAVLVDSLVDGLLIGLSSAASDSKSAGFVIAIALTFEMGFLALTFAAVMRKQPFVIAVLTLVAAPACLALGACGGAWAAETLEDSPALHTALISFGIAALLYLVTEELLLEAHEGQEEEHVWYVDFFFFFGFMASFLLEKFSDAAMR